MRAKLLTKAYLAVTMGLVAVFAGPLTAQAEEEVYAITDVMVTDNAALVPHGYTGVSWKAATLPSIPYEAGEHVAGTDVNTDIRGTTTSIWVKYERLPVTSTRSVLMDIAVAHWPGWNFVAPDSSPGWERAHGSSGGIKGGLTTGNVKPDRCWKNGLCVRYAPLKDCHEHVVALYLSITKRPGPVFHSPGTIDGRYVFTRTAGIDIHTGCGGRYFHVMKGSVATHPPSPPDPTKEVYAITDVMVTDDLRRVPYGYTGVTWRKPTLPFLPYEAGEWVAGTDVNNGIGGTTTSIWVKYERLPITSAKLVLVDIAVVRWPDWKFTAPNSRGTGWEPARGTSRNIQGALTTGTMGPCYRMGLDVKYAPLNEVYGDEHYWVIGLYLNIRTWEQESERAKAFGHDQTPWRFSTEHGLTECEQHSWGTVLCLWGFPTGQDRAGGDIHAGCNEGTLGTGSGPWTGQAHGDYYFLEALTARRPSM